MVRVLNINGDLTHIGLEVTQGGNGGNLFIAAETGELRFSSAVSALNPWGVAVLVAALLLSSLWFLRRSM